MFQLPDPSKGIDDAVKLTFYKLGKSWGTEGCCMLIRTVLDVSFYINYLWNS